MVTTVCYNKKEIWENRSDAVRFYFAATEGSDGSEQERYMNVLMDLLSGMKVCVDERD